MNNAELANLERMLAEFEANTKARNARAAAIASATPPQSPNFLTRRRQMRNGRRNLTTRSGRVAALSQPPSPTPSTNSSFEANVSSVTVDPKQVFPDATAHIVDVKKQISAISQQIETLRPSLKTAINSVKTLGALNIGDKSFRGSAGPQVYVAHNTNKNNYVVRGNFMAEGRPFRIVNENSFNSVLSQMKQKRAAAKEGLAQLSKVQSDMRGLEAKLASLDKDLKNSTMKLRRNMANYTAKQAKGLRTEARTKPTVRATSTSNVAAAQQLLNAPKPKSFFQKMFGRGRKTRRNTRK